MTNLHWRHFVRKENHFLCDLHDIYLPVKLCLWMDTSLRMSLTQKEEEEIGTWTLQWPTEQCLVCMTKCKIKTCNVENDLSVLMHWWWPVFWLLRIRLDYSKHFIAIGYKINFTLQLRIVRNYCKIIHQKVPLNSSWYFPKCNFFFF